MSWSESLPPGGMVGLAACVTNPHAKLRLRLVGDTAGPRSPPSTAFSRVRRSSPDICIAAP